MSSWGPTKYRTTNWSACDDALKRRGSLALWFDPDMIWIPPPSGKRGRQQLFSDAAIQTCLTLKVLFGMPLRQTTGVVQGLLRLAGLYWAVPDFSTLCRRQSEMEPWPLWGRESPSNAEREPPLSRGNRPAVPPHRQHRHQTRGRSCVACPQAWRPQTPYLAQVTHRASYT